MSHEKDSQLLSDVRKPQSSIDFYDELTLSRYIWGTIRITDKRPRPLYDYADIFLMMEALLSETKCFPNIPSMFHETILCPEKNPLIEAL